MMKTIIWQQSDVIVDREVESDEIVKIISQIGIKKLFIIFVQKQLSEKPL